MAQKYLLDPRLSDDSAGTLRRGLDAAGLTPTEGDDWILRWYLGPPPPKAFASLGPEQRVNHFPGYRALGHKGDLHRNLAAARSWTGNEFYDFHPRSFSLPHDHGRWRALAHAEPERLWLLKPPRGGGGLDIAFVRDPEEVPRDSDLVIQEYLDRPHLLDGHKYILRLWLLITSLDPLVCYMHDRGFLKVASRPYSTDPDSLAEPGVHVTNVAWGASYSDLRAYRARLRADGLDDELLMSRIRDALIQSVIASREQALVDSRPESQSLDRCFEILGPDILVDEDLKPWVLELNLFPDLGTPSECDEDVRRMVRVAKDEIVADMISLLGLGREGAPIRATNSEAYWKARATYELAGSRGFERIWPGPDAHRFESCFPLLRPLDRALSSLACSRISPTQPALRPSPETETHALGEGLVIYASGQPRLYGLNSVGAVTWLGLRDGLSTEEGIDELAGLVPEQPVDRIAGDYWDLLVAWARMGLLAGFEPAKPEGPHPAGPPLRVAAWHGDSLLIVGCDAGVSGCEDAVALPASDVRHLVLVWPCSGSAARLKRGHSVDSLDALIGSPGAELNLDSPGAAELIAWIDDLRISWLEIPWDDDLTVERALRSLEEMAEEESSVR